MSGLTESAPTLAVPAVSSAVHNSSSIVPLFYSVCGLLSTPRTASSGISLELVGDSHRILPQGVSQRAVEQLLMGPEAKREMLKAVRSRLCEPGR